MEQTVWELFNNVSVMKIILFNKNVTFKFVFVFLFRWIEKIVANAESVQDCPPFKLKV